MEIELHWTTWNFQPGHRLRVSISNAQWPMFWPTPSLGPNFVRTGGKEGSRFILPLLSEDASDGCDWAEIMPDPDLPGFEKLSEGTLSGFAEVSRIEFDSVTQTRSVVAVNKWNEAFPWGSYQNFDSIVHSTSDLNPAQTSVNADYRMNIQLPQRSLSIETELNFSSDLDSFYYDYSRTIRENEILLKSATWKEHLPRDHQ